MAGFTSERLVRAVKGEATLGAVGAVGAVTLGEEYRVP
jgi:hypothetical protein